MAYSLALLALTGGLLAQDRGPPSPPRVGFRLVSPEPEPRRPVFAMSMTARGGGLWSSYDYLSWTGGAEIVLGGILPPSDRGRVQSRRLAAGYALSVDASRFGYPMPTLRHRFALWGLVGNPRSVLIQGGLGFFMGLLLHGWTAGARVAYVTRGDKRGAHFSIGLYGDADFLAGYRPMLSGGVAVGFEVF